MRRSTFARGVCGAAPVVLAGLLLACLALLGPAGCNDDDPARPPTGGPEDPAALMQAFVTAYSQMDLTRYGDLLDPEYQFVPLPQDLEDLGLVAGETLPRVSELMISDNIFSGRTGTAGAPGILGISIVVMDRMGEWLDTESPLFPGSQEALFYVEVHFQHADGYFRVTGQQRFWIRNTPDQDGTPHWYLTGQQDLTGILKAVESMTWGRVKGLYR